MPDSQRYHIGSKKLLFLSQIVYWILIIPFEAKKFSELSKKKNFMPININLFIRKMQNKFYLFFINWNKIIWIYFSWQTFWSSISMLTDKQKQFWFFDLLIYQSMIVKKISKTSRVIIDYFLNWSKMNTVASDYINTMKTTFLIEKLFSNYKFNLQVIKEKLF